MLNDTFKARSGDPFEAKITFPLNLFGFQVRVVPGRYAGDLVASIEDAERGEVSLRLDDTSKLPIGRLTSFWIEIEAPNGEIDRSENKLWLDVYR